MTGIGGQGIQLAAAVVARAAVLDGREVQLFGSYGGMMRGGATAATLVVADQPIEAPPTVGRTWSAILMHHEHADATLARLGPDSVVFCNTSVVPATALEHRGPVVAVAATDLAGAAGGTMAASMVMVGAYAAATGLVSLASLATASRAALPPYRVQHADLNDRALRVGFDAVAPRTVPAWPDGAKVA